ncbi:MAG: metal ABC transporter permease [Acidimicrobiia bacterium]|nr:MAG: metal ABC transporter permease [Acidimicrobiia bacterium]
MDWLLEPFEFAFQQRALLAGSLAAVAAAIVGTWVVLRGMSFFGDALVHGVIPGIAVAFLLDIPPLIGAAIAAVAMVAGIGLVHRLASFSEDTGIGLLFVGMLALGVILVSRLESFAGSLTAILFGDALGVTGSDVTSLAIVAGVVVVASIVFYRPFLVLAFNEEKASMLGLRPTLAHFVLLALITLAIVGSFRTVGTLLVFGLLIGPAATAALISRRVPTTMALASAIGVASVAVGLLVSYHLGTAASATVAIIPVIAFFVVLVTRRVVLRPSTPGHGSTPT